MGPPKRMNFRKSSKEGGGVIFNPKIYTADVGLHENDTKGFFRVFLASQDAIEVMSVTDYLTDRLH